MRSLCITLSLISIAAKAQHANEAQHSSLADIKGTAYATAPWTATFKLGGLYGDANEESFSVKVHPEWAPEGAKRFQDMLQAGILTDTRFFRVVKDFMAQFGIPADPEVSATWKDKDIPDDPIVPGVSNKRGMMTFATAGPGTRTTQLFVNYKDGNSFLDDQGFTPFAEVLGEGMHVVDKIRRKYGESPNQARIQSQGNEYLKEQFPDLSFISSVTSVDLSSVAPTQINTAPEALTSLRKKQTL